MLKVKVLEMTSLGKNGLDGSDCEGLHCLVCNIPLYRPEDKFYNIFSKVKCFTNIAYLSPFEELRELLDRSLGNVLLHSDVICRRCFGLLEEHETRRKKLSSLRTNILHTFNKTATLYIAAKKGKIEVTDVHKTEKIEDQSCDNYKRIINEEGKVITVELKSDVVSECDTRNLASERKVSWLKQSIHKRFSCPVCRKQFRAFSHRVEHMLIHLEDKPWSCEECSKSFRTKHTLKIHVMRHSKELRFICDRCGKTFKDKTYFDEHSRIHSGVKPFTCEFCERHFTRRKDLVVHLKCHSDDKPYNCTVCTKRFAVKSRLERHALIHSGEKPYCCEHCGKSFSRKDDHKVHERQHTGERPFKCTFCNKTFVHQSNRAAHMRTHTDTKNYSCNKCEKSFRSQVKLRRHIALTHSKNMKVKDKETEKINEPEDSQINKSVEENVIPEGGQVSLIGLSPVSNTCLQEVQPVPVSVVTHVPWESSIPASNAAYVYTVPTTYVKIIN